MSHFFHEESGLESFISSNFVVIVALVLIN